MLSSTAPCPCVVEGTRGVDKKDSLLRSRIGDYVVQERLGSGGMGIVYRAVQPLIGKEVAVKVLKPRFANDSEEFQRLLLEARAVNAIQHWGIIDIFSFGVLPDGRHYMIMEYLRGTPLDAYLSRYGRMEPDEALPLLEEVLQALEAAHGAGVIHRDLKASNIFLVEQPDGTRYVKLLDFGLAKLAQAHSDTPDTVVGQMLGTPAYMAPEQVRGQPVGPSVDLYAFGVLTFQILTGQLPFSGDEPLQVALRQIEQEPPSLSRYVSGLPVELEALVLKLMAKQPEQRPASASHVRQELVRIRRLLLGSTQRLRPSRRSLAIPSFARPRSVLLGRLLMGGIVGGLLLVGVLLGVALGSPVPWPWGGGAFASPGAPSASAATSEEDASSASRGQPGGAEALFPEPSEESRLAPAATAPPSAVARAQPSSATETRKPSRSLRTRLRLLERSLREASDSGRPDPIAWMLLDKARQDAEAARTGEEREAVHRFLDEWERKFLHR